MRIGTNIQVNSTFGGEEKNDFIQMEQLQN
jgi:hypothetical protein